MKREEARRGGQCGAGLPGAGDAQGDRCRHRRLDSDVGVACEVARRLRRTLSLPQVPVLCDAGGKLLC